MYTGEAPIKNMLPVLLTVVLLALTSADPIFEKLMKLEKELAALKTATETREQSLQRQLALINSRVLVIDTTLRAAVLTKQTEFEQRLQLLEKNGGGGKGTPVPRRIKQYPLAPIESEEDDGILKTVWYQKQSSSSVLRVTWTGNVHTHAYANKSGGCNRWYFTFNNMECQSPQTIDSLYFAGELLSDHHVPITVDGICSGLPTGNIQIGLKVGHCATQSSDLGDAYTGYDEPTSIIVEEI